MLVAKMGQDGHDRGAKIIATAFADLGFDSARCFRRPRKWPRTRSKPTSTSSAAFAAGHQTLVPQLMDALKREGAGDILVVAGGVIPPQDYAALEAAGVAAIFGPGTNIPAAARDVLELVRARRVGEAAE